MNCNKSTITLKYAFLQYSCIDKRMFYIKYCQRLTVVRHLQKYLENMRFHLPDVNVCKTQKQIAIWNPVYWTPPWKKTIKLDIANWLVIIQRYICIPIICL
jgi:hypothetical protein